MAESGLLRLSRKQLDHGPEGSNPSRSSSTARSTSGRSPAPQAGQTGSTPVRATTRSARRLRPAPFQGADTGSNPVRVTDGLVVQLDGHRATNAVHGCSNHPEASTPARPGRHASFISSAGRVQVPPPVPAATLTARAPGRMGRRRHDKAETSRFDSCGAHGEDADVGFPQRFAKPPGHGPGRSTRPLSSMPRGWASLPVDAPEMSWVRFPQGRHGRLAKRQGSGLQNRHPRFNSGIDLQHARGAGLVQRLLAK